MAKSPPASTGDSIRDMGSIPESGRSPGGGHGNSLQYSSLKNPMDRGVWQAAVHEVAKSWTPLKWLSQTRLPHALEALARSLGFTGGAGGKEPACQYRRHERHRSDP